jgi:hypothetical protein
MAPGISPPKHEYLGKSRRIKQRHSSENHFLFHRCVLCRIAPTPRFKVRGLEKKMAISTSSRPAAIPPKCFPQMKPLGA